MRSLTTIAPGITTCPSNAGTDLFIGGTRVGSYKTQRALDAAVARHTSPDAIARYAAVVDRLDPANLAAVADGRRRLGANDAERDAVQTLARTRIHPSGRVLHAFEDLTGDMPETCVCGAYFGGGYNLGAVKIAHLKHFGAVL